jgi:PAS domain S-box-containing protein
MSTDQVREQKHADQREFQVQEDGEVLRVTRSSVGEAVMITDASGRVTFLNALAESLTGWTCPEAQGQPREAVFGIVNEASRRQMAQEVTDARTYAADIVATVREPLVIFDAELRVRLANQAFYQEFGIRPADTVGRFLYDLGDGQWNIPALRKLLGELLLKNISFQNFEMEWSVPGLGRRTKLLNARRVLGEGIHRGMILLAIEDITEHTRAAQAVAISEIRYRRLFETAQDAILILDADSGRIFDANPFIVDMLGYTHEELMGKELWEICLFEDRQANRAAMRRLQEQGYIRYEDLPLETSDGQCRDVEFVSNVYSVQGHPVIQCNIRDITDRKRAERAVKDADNRKDEFLATLAHELRNPLASLRGAIQVMQVKGTADPDVRWARDVVERQVHQLTRLVDDLLDVSSFNQGKVNLQLGVVDLADVVARAVEMSRPLIDSHKHDLHVSLPAKALCVEGDLARLAQVLSNLLNNAAKYTEAGGHIDLTVETGGAEAVLRVRDTGVGIAADMLPHIFEMFTQVRGSVGRSEGGLGIGLTLVRKLVEMHGGRVEAHSEGPGHGSEFIVRLPLQPAAAPPAAAATEVRMTRKAIGRRILIVDDNQDAAESMAMLLRYAGHEVRTAHDGLAGLELAQTWLPDALLLDIRMPGIDGLEVARRLRREFDKKQPQLIAMTGYDQVEDHRRSQEAGFDAHLVKPVDLATLEDLLALPVAIKASNSDALRDIVASV